MKPDSPRAPLDDALRDSGSIHEVGELETKGIRSVRILSTSHLQSLIRVSVNRTLQRSIGDLELPEETRDLIRDRAEAEYQRLVQEGVEPAADEHRSPGGGAPTPDTPRLEIPPRSDEFKAFEDRMIQNISQLLEKDWRSELARVQSSQHQQLSLLEQRISKLVRALESTDRVLSHVQRGREPGSAAIDGKLAEVVSPLGEKKSQLLTALFQANLKLRELQDEQSP